MVYATVETVQALMPEYTLNEASKPSVSEVTSFIAQIEAAVNGVLLSQGYATVPATGANDVTMLQGYVATKVAAMALLVAFQGNEIPGKVKLWTEDFAAFMSRLRQGQQRLIDQSPTVAQENEVVFTKIRVLPRVPGDG